ncbi:MAG: DUF1800 domain-containing protein [Oceanicaulis sp.]
MKRAMRLGALALAGAMILAGCDGGSPDAAPPPPAGTASPTGPFATAQGTAQFLTQASFGPTPSDIDRYEGRSASEWFENQLVLQPTYLSAQFDRHMDLVIDGGYSGFRVASPTILFWKNAVGAPDQLRQRMAFALSQILVVSASSGQLRNNPEGMVYYQDLLIEHAFGNYRELLEDVTYSPAMGYYLTYIGSKKADPDTGRMPDENYARELLQLFTIGVVDTDMQGRVLTDGAGRPRELYGNEDIEGLARVFTGFEFSGDRSTPEGRRAAWRRPLEIDPRDHSEVAKTFLGYTIPAGTSGEASVDMALDHIMAQPTLPPFIARQLIQRFVTSAPSPDYVGRVARAFDEGRYQLPNMVTVGDGRRGDLAATIAAVLFDEEATDVEASRADPRFGKIREPILRLVHWARAFGVDANDTEWVFDIYDTRSSDNLAQNPYQSPSVFNFYRPGYIAPGTETGAADMTVPELQLFTTATAPGYVNFLDNFVLADPNERDASRIADKLSNLRVNLSAGPGVNAWVADYAQEIALAGEPEALLDRLDLILTGGTLSAETRAIVREHLEADAASGDTSAEAVRDRVQFAVLMIMTSPDFLVQR